jgi:hypothetical protein
MDLASFAVEAVIVHEVPARLVRGGSPPPSLSDLESPMDDELRAYIADRMRETLHTKGIDVRFDDAVTLWDRAADDEDLEITKILDAFVGNAPLGSTW